MKINIDKIRISGMAGYMHILVTRRRPVQFRLFALVTTVAFAHLLFLPACSSLAEAAEQRIRYFHPDHLGSTALVTDENGHVIERVAYKPFGEVYRREIRDPTTGQLIVGNMAPSVSPYGFTGQRHDSDTGLYFYGARYYDPQLGRFTQPDPFIQDPADPQVLNRYTYVRNNPVNFVDPSGNFIELLIAIAITVFVTSSVISIGASITSLVASATGHERTAQRSANVAGTAGQIAFWSGLIAGQGPAAAITSLLASTAQGVAADTGSQEGHLFGNAFSRHFNNAVFNQLPGVSQLYGLSIAIRGVNPLTGERLSPLDRALTGGLSLMGFGGPRASAFAHQLTKATRVSTSKLIERIRVRHFTNTTRRTAITESKVLRKGTFVTKPSEIPSNASQEEIKELLELPNITRTRHRIDVTLDETDLAVPENGPMTSGGKWQRVLKRNVPIDPEDFRAYGRQ